MSDDAEPLPESSVEADARSRCVRSVLPLQTLLLVLALPTVRACNRTLNPFEVGRTLGGAHLLLVVLTFGLVGVLAVSLVAATRAPGPLRPAAFTLNATLAGSLLAGSVAHLALRLGGAMIPHGPPDGDDHRLSAMQWLLAHRPVLLFECLSVALMLLAARGLYRCVRAQGFAQWYELTRALGLSLWGGYVSAMLVRWWALEGRAGLAWGAAVWVGALSALLLALRPWSPLKSAAAR